MPESKLADERSLSDFGELSTAEARLLECCQRGWIAKVGEALPNIGHEGNQVRAGFVRFLALGGDHEAPVHEQGVRLDGGWLDGLLDLTAVHAQRRIVLWSCRIEKIIAVEAHLQSLSLSGSLLEAGLIGDGLRCDGSILLRSNFKSGREIRLAGARISGSLDCSGGRFEASDQKNALLCDGAKIEGSLFLNHDFYADGAVRLVGVQIGGVLDCIGSSFHNPAGSALSCSRSTVGGALFFREIKKLAGEVNLSGMHVSSLCDDRESWMGARGELMLDGFTYSRLAGGAPSDAATRIAWLESQTLDYLGVEFRPQPWEQLIGVLRAMGHPNEARRVAIAKQVRLRRSRRIVKGARGLHWLYGALVGYGYRVPRLAGMAIAVWLACAFAYWGAANPQWFGETNYLIAPAKQEPSAACLVARALTHDGDPCLPPTPDYANFAPIVYSADVMLPIISLGYKAEWKPVVRSPDGKPLVWGKILRALYWTEIVFGWVTGALLIGALGNLIKKD